MADRTSSFMSFIKPLLPIWASGPPAINMTEEIPMQEVQERPRADTGYAGGYNQGLSPMFTISFNGEKNLGEAGPIKNYLLDYDGMRARSWQAYLENDVFKTIIDRMIIWTVSTGLKLQCQPNRQVLLSEDIELDTEAFNEVMETRYSVWANSASSDYAGMTDLCEIAEKAELNALIGGDVLVIQRVDADGNNTSQLIDGVHVQSPTIGTDWYPQQLANGNKIISGIEMDARGRHIRYFVRQRDMSFITYEAWSASTGLRMVYLYYGSKYRLDNHRGMPLMAVAIEKIKKMERYSEATLGTAEEAAKIVYQVVHQMFSNGENPLVMQMAKAARGTTGGPESLPRDIQGKNLANTVAATTNKQTYNMPIGSKIETMGKNENTIVFKEFYGTNAEFLCACANIPPSVAFSLYTDSFSASRAAIMDWQHTISTKRYKIKKGFYQPNVNLFMHLQVLKNKVSAPGYLKAFMEQNIMVVEAYRTCRFTGPLFPHIDPKKEADAARVKLGINSEGIPLSTVQQVTEDLNGGDSDQNMAQFYREFEDAKSKGLIPVNPVVTETLKNQ